MPNVHYTVSPSRLHRWLACPASFLEEQKYPEKPGGPAAIDGTHSHTLLEHCINDGLKDAFFFIGEELEDHEGTFTVDAERAQRVNIAIHYLQQRKQELGVCAIRAEETSNPGQAVGWDDWRGTCDVTLLSDNTLEIIDYKDGRTPQDPKDNPQLLSYLQGRLLEYDTAFEVLRCTIIQPRCNPPISHHHSTTEELTGFREKVVGWREVAESGEAPFEPGEKQCRWCNARGGCAALAKHSLQGVAMQFQAVEVAQQAADKEPSQMTDEQLREFIEGIPLLKQAIAAAEEEAMRRFQAGHKIPGLKAVRGRGSRQWAYEEDEMADKLKRMGIPKSALYVTKLISPSQAEKVSWQKRDGTRKTLSKRQLNTLAQDYIKRSEGKVQIVPASDERDEVSLGVNSLFGAVEDEPKIELPPELQF